MMGIAITFTALCPAFGALFLRAYEAGQVRRAFWLKGLAGLCFVAVGLALAMERVGCAYPRRIFFGLVLGLMGDELLALRFVDPERHDAFFVAGALAFAAGHGMYLFAMWRLDGGAWLVGLAFLAVGLALSAWYAKRKRTDAGKLMLAGYAYIALVVAVAGLALALLVRGRGLRALLLALGGVCFAVSDNLLSAYCFGDGKTTRVNIWVHVTYYAAQLLIAWSIAGA